MVTVSLLWSYTGSLQREPRFWNFCSNHKIVFILWMGMIILLVLIIYWWELIKRLFSVYNFSKIYLPCMKVATSGHLYQAELLGWAALEKNCMSKRAALERTVCFPQGLHEFPEKSWEACNKQAGNCWKRWDYILNPDQVSHNVSSSVLESCLMLVTSQTHFLGAWLRHWSLIAEVLKTHWQLKSMGANVLTTASTIPLCPTFLVGQVL